MSIVISCPRRVGFEQLPHSRRADRRRGNASVRVGNRVGSGISGYDGRLQDRADLPTMSPSASIGSRPCFRGDDYRLCRITTAVAPGANRQVNCHRNAASFVVVRIHHVRLVYGNPGFAINEYRGPRYSALARAFDLTFRNKACTSIRVL